MWSPIISHHNPEWFVNTYLDSDDGSQNGSETFVSILECPKHGCPHSTVYLDCK